MTSATAGDRPGRESRVHRAAMWLGHYAPRITLAFDVVLVVYVLCWLWLPVRPALASVFVVLAMGDVAAMLCGDFVHGRNLCPRDLDDTLLDPQGAVDKNMRRLWWVHGARQRRLASIAGLVMLALLIFVGQLPHLPWPLRAAATVVTIAAGAAVAYGALSLLTHQRLQPWCPWCRHGGRGPRSRATAPDPQPVGTRDT